MINAAFLVYDRTLFSGVTRPYEILKAVNAMSKLDGGGRQLNLTMANVAPEQPKDAGDIPLHIQDNFEDLGPLD